MRTRASGQSRSQVNARRERSKSGRVRVYVLAHVPVTVWRVCVCVDCLEISSVQFYMMVYASPECLTLNVADEIYRIPTSEERRLRPITVNRDHPRLVRRVLAARGGLAPERRPRVSFDCAELQI